MDIQNQHSLARKVSCNGVGLHSGEKVHMVLHPAPENSGIRFVRTDVKGFNPEVVADYRNVTATNLGTTIANDDGTIVSTVEHLMAALWGENVDNAVIELDGPEVPIMDGSAEPFVFLLECAGVVEQKSERRVVEILDKVEVVEGDKHISVEPADNFSVSLEIDFNDKIISRQKSVFHSSDISFKTDLCRARSFCLEDDIEKMRSLGLAKGGSLENAVVVGNGGVLNKGGLRYQNEFVRHKILDCIGDFYLGGGLLKGHFSGYRSGHDLNNKLLRKLFTSKHSWRLKPSIPPVFVPA